MFKVFPATIDKNGDKVPLLNAWQTLATDDKNQIKMWQDQWGTSLTHWGIPCGRKNKILVLDIDVKSPEKNGWDTIKQNRLEIPVTLSQRTISGGTHFFFEYPEGLEISNKVGFLPGLDIRSEGGYIFFYGQDFDPLIPIAKAPQWLIDAGLKKHIEVGKSAFSIDPTIANSMIEEALEAIRNAPAGESNNILNLESFKVGQIVAAGAISRELAESKLLEAAIERKKPRREALATIESGMQGGMRNPLTCPFESVNPKLIFDIPEIENPIWTPNPFTIDDLNNTAMLRKPQLFKDWSSEDIIITTADGGTGKTTLKLQEAICLALGIPFLGFQCLQQGRTLYITGEDSEKKIGAMLGQQMRQMGIKDDLEKVNLVLSSIFVKKDSDMCIVSKDRQGFLVHSAAAREKVMQAVRTIRPKMIVFDPIASFWGPESAVNDMNRAVIKFVSELVEVSGAAVEMINHMGKMSSASKDMSQFAGRGGTGLPSNSRISRVLRPIPFEEYTELTGKELSEDKSAILCNVNKFTDGSPLFNKPFLIIRNGYLFEREVLAEQKAREVEQKMSDEARVFNFIKEARNSGKYPTQKIVVAHFSSQADKISKARVEMAIQTLGFGGYMGEYVKTSQHPDVTVTEKILIITDESGKEIVWDTTA